MTIGIECLVTDSFERGLELAQQLDQLNRERRALESDMQLDALAAIDEATVDSRSTICLFAMRTGTREWSGWLHRVEGEVPPA
jgi:single-stranded-DNA-specific exonuclease